MDEVIELAKICQRVYPGPLNQLHLTITGMPFEKQKYVHGSGGRGFCRILYNEQSVVIAFRGTREKIDWSLSNLKLFPVRIRDVGRHAGLVFVHRGFQNALDCSDKTSGKRSLDRIFELIGALGVGDRDLWITGHSLGGALATIFAVKLRATMPQLVRNNLRAIVLFGTPAVGGLSFKKFYGDLDELTTRYINNRDPIPFTPPVGYRHVGNGHWCKNGIWQADPGWLVRLYFTLAQTPPSWAKDHAIKSYISAIREVPLRPLAQRAAATRVPA